MNLIQRFLMLALLGLTPVLLSAESTTVEFHRQYVDGPDGQIHVLSSKPVSNSSLQTPMICLAPNPASGNYFRMFMEVLGQDRIMIAPDYPGLGESDPPAVIPDMAEMAIAMAITLEQLGYGPAGSGMVDVCGYHTGAMVAIELAVLRPDLVRRVLLMGVPFYLGEERQAEYDKNVVVKPIGEDFDSLQGSWEFAVTNRQQGVSLERGYDNFIDVLKAQNRRHYAYQAVFTYPAEERAPLVKQPVLILNTHGSLELETRAIAPFFPTATLIEIPELHHGIFDVGADILTLKAKPFLDKP